MKCTRIAIASVMACAALTTLANAQIIETPSSVKPIGFTYDYYEIGQPGEASPSDVPPAEAAEEAPMDAAVAPAAGHVDVEPSYTYVECEGCESEGCESCECDSCDGCGCECSCYLFGDEAWTLQEFLFGDCENVPTIGGWLEYGYYSNNIPVSFARADLLSFGDNDTGQLSQAYLYAEKVADGECGWGIGYRADVMYGTHAQKTQAFGNSLSAAGNATHWDNDFDNGIYGWAIPQLYLELARGDLSVIAGHFYTLVGYEVVTAPDNFFYTNPLTMFNSEPFTHTGVLATYGLNDNVELYGGWTLGWDTGFDQLDGGSSWLGGASVTLTDNVSVTYISTAGNFGLRGTNAYSHSIVIDVQLTDKLEYVCQSDLVSIRNANPNGIAPAPAGGNPNTPLGNDQYSINQYMFYTINDCLALGARAEWWKSDGVSYHEITGGVNWRPHPNLLIRPEVRYDWTPARAAATRNSAGFLYTDPNNPNDMTSFSISGIFTF